MVYDWLQVMSEAPQNSTQRQAKARSSATKNSSAREASLTREPEPRDADKIRQTAQFIRGISQKPNTFSNGTQVY
jgi:cytochrome c556